AARLYRVALDARPEQAGPWCSLSAVLNELGNYTESLAATEMALALDPTLAAAWDNQGNALQRHEEALDAYAKALALAPNDPGILAHEAAARQATEQGK